MFTSNRISGFAMGKPVRVSCDHAFGELSTDISPDPRWSCSGLDCCDSFDGQLLQ